MIRIRYVFLVVLALLPAYLTAAAQESIPWITDLAQARQIAEQNQRLVLLHFWGDGCPPCQRLEINVFNQPELIRAISTSFVPVKIHVQQQPHIASHYKITQIPTDIIVLPSGVQVFRTTSPASANEYLAMLDQARGDALAGGLQPNHRSVAAAVEPAAPSLPPRNPDEVPTAQSLNTEWTTSSAGLAGSQPGHRSAPDEPGAPPRGSAQTNEFVGPLDQKPQADANRTTPSRYGNPYVTESTGPAQRTSPPPPPAASTAATPSTPPPFQSAPHQAPQDSGSPEGPPTPAAPGNTFVSNAMPNNNQGTAPEAQASANRFVQMPNALTGQPQPTVHESSPYGAGPGTATPSPNQAAMNPAPAQPQFSTQTSPQFSPQTPLPNSPPSQSQLSSQLSPQRQLQMPPGTPPMALDGFCAVTLMNFGKWERGDPRFGAIHRDRLYLFKSQMEKDRFLAPAAADRFAPVLSGLDPVRFTDMGQNVEGRREHGVLFDGKIYLFADEEALTRFEQQPQRYVAAVHQAMANARMAPPQR